MSKLRIPVTLTSGINEPVVEASEVKDVSFNKNQSKINEDTSRAIGNINNLVVGEDNLVDAINVNSNSIVTLDETKANKVDVQTALDLKADKTDLNSYVNDASYDSNTKRINFKHNSTILAYIDATDFIKDGMVSNVTIENGYLVITFNTDSGQEPIRLALTDIFNPNNYYTKNAIDNKLGSLEFPTGDNNVTDAINTTIRNLTYGLDNLDTTKADKTEVDAELAKKANTDGWYPRMVVGAAESLIGKDISVDEATDYVVQGGTGVAKVNEVIGRSEKWNQLVEPVNVAEYSASDVTTSIAGGVLQIQTATTGASARYIRTNIVSETTLIGKQIGGHKYYSPDTLPSGCHFDANVFGSGFVLCRGTISTGIETTNIQKWSLVVDAGTIVSTLTSCPILIFDLTDIYGEGNEPTTVEQFEADVFAKYGKTLDEYFEYDAGSINNANVEKLDITGLNQWDEQWEPGTYDSPTGNKLDGSPYGTGKIRSANYIQVFPNITYYVNDANFMFWEYDVDKNYIKYSNSTGRVPTNGLFTTSKNCFFIRFRTVGTTYNHDICINISNSTKNGTYEPYRHTELPINIKTITGKVNGEGESVTIFPNGMRGVGTAYDSLIVDEDGWCRRAIVRMAIQDLGASDMVYYKGSGGTYTFYLLKLRGIIKSNTANIISNKFINGATSGDATGTMDCDSIGTLYFALSPYTDAASFKSAMQGVPLIYELKTPIEYVLDEPILMTFNAYNGGVIRQIKGDMELATRINITFALNVQGFINNANKAFVSAASMQAFLTKLSSAKGGTWGMTYNTTTQQYEFTYNQ